MTPELSDRILFRQEKVFYWANDAPAALRHNYLMSGHHTSETITTRWQGRKVKFYLKRWRQYRKLFQEQLGAMMAADGGEAMSKSHVSNIERGIKQFNEDTLVRFAKALNCHPADLLSRDPSTDETILTLWNRLPDNIKPQAREVLKALMPANSEDQRRAG